MEIKRIICKIILLIMVIVMCNSCKCYAALPGNQINQIYVDDGGGGGGASYDTSLEGNAELGLPTLDNSYKPQVTLGSEDGGAFNIISTLLTFLTIIGICVIIVSTAVIGFDSMLGSASKKAIAQEKYVGLLVAALLLTGGSVLARIIINMAQGI